MLIGSPKLTKTTLLFSAYASEQNLIMNHFIGIPPRAILHSPKWIGPTLLHRAKYAANGPKSRFVFFHCDEDWSLDSSGPMKYATALACLRRMAKLRGFDDKFTLRIPRAALPTWASQLGWRKDGRTALGRRALSQKCPIGTTARPVKPNSVCGTKS